MNPPPDAGEQDLPEYSLETYRREGLLSPPGAEPAAHDGTGRVQLSFTVEDKEAPPVLKQVRVPPGVSVFDSASWNGIAIDSTCGGHGTCHKCKVRVSPATAVSRHDARTFSTAELDAGWRLACLVAGDPRPRGRRTAADHAAEGRDRRRRPPGHPAARGPEAVRRARRADPRGPAPRPRPAAGGDRRPRAGGRPPCPAPAPRRAAAGGLQGDRGRRRRGTDRRRARRHDRRPARDRVRPRAPPRSSPPCSTW